MRAGTLAGVALQMSRLKEGGVMSRMVSSTEETAGDHRNNPMIPGDHHATNHVIPV